VLADGQVVGVAVDEFEGEHGSFQRPAISN
jgi:hypothetical protein